MENLIDLIHYKCRKCAEEFEVGKKGDHFETPNGQKVCPACGLLICAQNDASGTLAKAFQTSAEKAASFKSIVEKYEATGDSKDICTTVQGYSKNINAVDFENFWRDFIISAAGASANRNDIRLQTFLKNHAKELDSKINSNLFLSMLQAYPNVGTNSDWNELIKGTQGKEGFSVLCDSIIEYISSHKDKAFAIDIFNLINAKKQEWANAGEIYLRQLLTNEKIANDVFTVSAFNGKSCKFVLKAKAYISNYLNNAITIEETNVWNNYSIARKRRKRRNIIIVSSVVAALAAAGAATFFILNSTNRDSVKFNIDRVIEATYGEELDLSDFSVTYNKIIGTQMSQPITIKMFNGYDSEIVGTQQTVTVEFGGASTTITVIVHANKLATPVLTLSNDYVSWEFVNNADSYSIYVNGTSAPVATIESFSYDLSTNVNYGDLSVWVRANTGSDKYTNSEMAQLTVSKLQAPTGIKYENGVLSWDAVSGVDKYELVVARTSYETTTNSLSIGLAQGETDVKIIAKSNKSSVVSGVTDYTVKYYKLSAISAMSYSNNRISWTAVSGASQYDVYVDGTLWRDFSRNYFDVETDGFKDRFGETQHKIEIVCKSSLVGTEASDKVGYTVAFGNNVTVEDNMLKWDSVEQGATYFVKVGDSELELNSPKLSFSDVTWADGDNQVEITAKCGGETIICETYVITKLIAPVITVLGGELYVEDNAKNEQNRFSVNGGAWTAELPNVSAFGSGETTVKVKRVSYAQNEMDSKESTLKFYRPAAPVIAVTKGEVECTYDTSLCDIKLYYGQTVDGEYKEISSLSSIVTEGKYYLVAKLEGKAANQQEYDYVFDSANSTPIEVTKLATPSVFYTQGNDVITSDNSRAKFYYVENGEEKECVGGLVANLPAGVITVYARVNAVNPGEISSENTPSDDRVSIYNLAIKLSINTINDMQMNAVFSGCDDIDSLTFTYEINYYNSYGTYIGQIPKSVEITVEKVESSPSVIVRTINYFSKNANFETGYTFSDVSKVELVVHIASGTNEMQLSAECNV